jgi:K(+)-stimulated pyrophosphate-energized sodium pump
MYLIWFSIGAAVLALVYALVSASMILKQPKGTQKMNDVASAIQEGANAFLKRQYKTVFAFWLALAIIFALLAHYFPAEFPSSTPIAFTVGAWLSALAGYIGMQISVRANLRTAKAAEKGLEEALHISFVGGTVTGMSVVGLALLGFSIMYLMINNPIDLIGFGFGASLVSLFARVGGGIYTKGADVGADLVGKSEIGLPEDDPRNPAVIADNVGDNVGDCAGMAADLFESYVITVLAAMLLAPALSSGLLVTLPLAVGGVGVIASIIGTYFVKTNNKNKIWKVLNNSILISALLSVAGFFVLTFFILPVVDAYVYFYPLVAGIVVAILISYITGHYTNKNTAAVREIAIASKSGAGTTIIYGVANGMRATALPVVVIVCAVLFSYYTMPFGQGVFGIALAAMAMLSLTGIVVSVDSYGPITDNAGGIAEMSGMSKKIRDNVTDPLDAVGNTTKAVTKGFAIGAAALAALSLFVAFANASGVTSIDILNPLVICGLFLGAMIPYVFSAIAMRAVGSAASKIVDEVRSQFRSIKGLMQGKAKPDYAKAVDITTKAAIRSLIAPALLGILSPVFVGFILGPYALGGLLAGVIISGLVLALMMTTGGAAWDNAKKYVEEGHFGGKGSDTHKAAVVGDTVGDPFKDTAGPGLNPLIKVINMVSLLIAPAIIGSSLPLMLHIAII